MISVEYPEDNTVDWMAVARNFEQVVSSKDAEIARLQEQVETLTKERDAIDHSRTYHAARALAAEAEQDRLREALKPFVEYTPERCFGGNEKWKPAVCRDTGGGWYGAEDFRRARAALQKEPQP